MVSSTELALRVVTLIICFTISHAVSNTPITSPHPFHVSHLKRFITLRCGTTNNRTNPSLWLYEGQLLDPSNGRKIADVEGLEMVHHVTDTHYYPPPNTTTTQKQPSPTTTNPPPLSYHHLLTSPPPSSWDYATTIHSRKLFAYRDPTNPTSLLRRIRIRPGPAGGKAREISPREALSRYDTVTTYISRDGGREMAIHTEWPDGRWIVGRVAEDSSLMEGRREEEEEDLVGGESYTGRRRRRRRRHCFDFAVFARGQYDGTKIPKLAPLMRRKDDDDGGVSASPPRSRLVQFGADKSTSTDRYGARETYGFDFGSSLSSSSKEGRRKGGWFPWLGRGHGQDDDDEEGDGGTVRYTRYGECPPWYGPGRICALELRGRKISSLEEVTPLVAGWTVAGDDGMDKVASPRHSGVGGGGGRDDNDSEGAFVRWFRDESRRRIEGIDDAEGGWRGTLLDWGNKIRQAVVLKAGS